MFATSLLRKSTNMTYDDPIDILRSFCGRRGPREDQAGHLEDAQLWGQIHPGLQRGGGHGRGE